MQTLCAGSSPPRCAHLFAGLAASGLAALDDYVTAAFGYAAGSAAGLVLILQRVDADGIVAVAWGMALNGAIALLVPVAVLVARSASEHACDGRSSRRAPAFVSARRICGRRGAADSAPAALCRVSAVRWSSGARRGHELRLRVPRGGEPRQRDGVLARPRNVRPVDAPRARGRGRAVHVVSAAWVALTVIGAAVGAFALAGGGIVEGVLGDAYSGDVGRDVGRLVVLLSPWMIASVGVNVAFPLAFVASACGRCRGSVRPHSLCKSRLPGLSRSSSSSTASPSRSPSRRYSFLGPAEGARGSFEGRRATWRAATGIVAGIGAVAFAPPALLLAPRASVTVGLLVYVTLFALIRPRALMLSWRYLRALG